MNIDNMTKKELLEDIQKKQETLKTIKDFEFGICYALKTIQKRKEINMSREEFIKKYRLEEASEFVEQDADGTILYKILLTDDIEVCYWVTKDYRLESIDLMIWKDGDCDYTGTLSVEDGFRIRGIK